MSSPSITNAIRATVDALLAADVDATSDSSRIRTPGVWVLPRECRPATLLGDWEYVIDLYLVVGNIDDPRAYERLDELAAIVGELFPLLDDDAIRPTRVSQISGSDFPAYQYPTSITL